MDMTSRPASEKGSGPDPEKVESASSGPPNSEAVQPPAPDVIPETTASETAAQEPSKSTGGTSRLAQGARRYLEEAGDAGWSPKRMTPEVLSTASASEDEAAAGDQGWRLKAPGQESDSAPASPLVAPIADGGGPSEAGAEQEAVGAASSSSGGEGPATADDPSEPFEDPLADCLSFLSRLYGHGYSSEQLRVGLPLKDGRLDLEGLFKSAQRIGLETTRETRGFTKIPPLALPAILLLDDGRACVLLRHTSKSTVEIYEPSAGDGTTLVRASDVEAAYSGELVYARPEFRFDTRSNVLDLPKPRSWFWGALLGNWWIYGHAILATIVVNFLALASPIFILTVYDRVVPNNAVETMWVLAFGVMGAACFDFVLRSLRGYMIDAAGKRLDVLLGNQLFDHVVRMRMDSGHSSAGSLASVMREFDFLRDFMSSATITAIGDLPFIFIFIFAIWLIGGPIAYVPMVIVPFVITVSILVQLPLHAVTRNSMQEATQKNAHLFEVLHGIETIKAIRAESWAERKWEALVGLTAMSSMRMKMLSQISLNMTMAAQLLTTVGIVLVGVPIIGAGDMSSGGLIACVLLSSRVLSPLAQVAGILVRWEQTKMALNALGQLMRSPVERPPEEKLVHKPHLEGAVELKEVDFTYPGQETQALIDVSFKITPGEHVAIIGRVGSGKSTVLKLVQNLYSPVEGFVRVDDLDTRQIELSDLRRQIGYVPQETVLFQGTMRENLVQGAPQATDQQVLQAADLAGLVDMIKQSPKGLDHNVGERGTALSGGQRQMIVLARALVLDPPMLLMDEPTSNMDNFAERQFIEKIKPWLAGRTLVLVTHRASLLTVVDRIIVMDKGRVVADGPKDEVLSKLAAGRIGAAAA